MSPRAVAGALALVLSVSLAAPTSGQESPPGPNPGDVRGTAGPLTVHLVTVGPGDAVWERFGHNAIWIHDARTGQDIWWNWGLFTFDQEGFLARLVRGEMLYSMGGREMAYELAQYRAQGRDVWAQELALSPSQAAELDRLVRTNAQPSNRDYIYDYYEDNCSTRVRDALDTVLDGALRRHFSDLPAGTTWRAETRRHVEVSPLTDAGIALVLGQDGDETITAWESMFLPLELRARIGGLLMESRDGSMRTLVLREFKVVDGGRALPPDEAGALWPTGLLAGLVGALVLVLAGAAAGRAGGDALPGRLAVALPVSVWSLLAGVAGLVLAGAYLTDHDFWTPNENLLATNPLSIAVAVLALAALVHPALLATAARLARWCAGLAVAALVLKLLPWFSQDNWPVLVAALPLHLAAAWALTHASRDRRSAA